MTEITIFDKIVAKEIPSKGIYEDELVIIKYVSRFMLFMIFNHVHLFILY